MGNRCSIQQSEESNCWLEQSPENRLYRLFRSFWATLYILYFLYVFYMIRPARNTKVWNRCSHYQDIYDWISSFNKPLDVWFILTQHSMGEMNMVNPVKMSILTSLKHLMMLLKFKFIQGFILSTVSLLLSPSLVLFVTITSFHYHVFHRHIFYNNFNNNSQWYCAIHPSCTVCSIQA